MYSLDRHDLVVQLRVLEPDGELARQGLQEIQLVPVKGIPESLGPTRTIPIRRPSRTGIGDVGAPGLRSCRTASGSAGLGRAPTWSRTSAAAPSGKLLDERASPDTTSAGRTAAPWTCRVTNGAKASRDRGIRTRMARLEMEGLVDERPPWRSRPARGRRRYPSPGFLTDQGPRVVGGPVQA